MAENFSPNQTLQKRSVQGAGGVVAAQHRMAARVGAGILARGGNAVDAAIATAFALGVVEPWMSGIGGGGLMLVHMPDDGNGPGTTRAVDFSMIAPQGLDPDAYPLADGVGGGLFGWPAVAGERNIFGATAAAVPGFVAGMGVAHGEFGRLPWGDLLEPAIAMARDGLALDWYACLTIANNARPLNRDETARRVFLPDGLPPAVPRLPDSDERLVLPGLADTLESLRDDGAGSFYRGPLADRIAAETADRGGCLTADDLDHYRAHLVDPIEIPHGDDVVWATPGLNAGPSLAAVIDNSQRDRRKLIPDESFYHSMAQSLREALAQRLATMGARGSSSTVEECTTHLAVVDREGMMVSLTNTLVSPFGSGVLLPGTGILLNNGISWFDPRPGRPNSLAPGARPLSNMCPAIGRRRDGCLFALGASGGRRILGAVAQVVCFLTDFRLDLEESLRQPRIDVSSMDDTVVADPDVGRAALEFLEQSFKVHARRRAPLPSWYANVSAVMRYEDTNYGAAEPALPWADAVMEDAAD